MAKEKTAARAPLLRLPPQAADARNKQTKEAQGVKKPQMQSVAAGAGKATMTVATPTKTAVTVLADAKDKDAHAERQAAAASQRLKEELDGVRRELAVANEKLRAKEEDYVQLRREKHHLEVAHELREGELARVTAEAAALRQQHHALDAHYKSNLAAEVKRVEASTQRVLAAALEEAEGRHRAQTQQLLATERELRARVAQLMHSVGALQQPPPVPTRAPSPPAQEQAPPKRCVDSYGVSGWTGDDNVDWSPANSGARTPWDTPVSQRTFTPARAGAEGGLESIFAATPQGPKGFTASDVSGDEVEDCCAGVDDVDLIDLHSDEDEASRNTAAPGTAAQQGDDATVAGGAADPVGFLPRLEVDSEEGMDTTGGGDTTATLEGTPGSRATAPMTPRAAIIVESAPPPAMVAPPSPPCAPSDAGDDAPPPPGVVSIESSANATPEDAEGAMAPPALPPLLALSSGEAPPAHETRMAPAQPSRASEFRGRVPAMCMELAGSRMLQHILGSAGCTAADVELIFDEVEPIARDAMQDMFGNHVIQHLFQHGAPHHVRRLVELMVGGVLDLTLSPYGCRVVQVALEHADATGRAAITDELAGHVHRCVDNQNGNYVVQKCIETAPERVGFIVAAFLGNVRSLAKHAYGCRIIEKLLELWRVAPEVVPIVEEVLSCLPNLVRDRYGNYVAQHVILHGDADLRGIVFDMIYGHVLVLARDKFASNVVEKMFEYATPPQRDLLLDELLQVQGDGRWSNLMLMVQDPFANYVVQKMLDTWSSMHQRVVADHLHPFIPSLKGYTHGKHIIARLEKAGLIGAVAPPPAAPAGGAFMQPHPHHVHPHPPPPPPSAFHHPGPHGYPPPAPQRAPAWTAARDDAPPQAPPPRGAWAPAGGTAGIYPPGPPLQAAGY